MAEYRSEKVVKAGKKTFRILKVNKHIRVYDANSKAENPKVLFDSEKSDKWFHRWLREQSRKK